MTNRFQISADAVAEFSDAWRVLGHLGLVDTVFNHISSVVEGGSGPVLMMNPRGFMAGELRPETVCMFPLREYDHKEAMQLGVNSDGLRLHSLMQTARGAAGTIVHTHSLHALAVGCSESGLLPLSQTAMEFMDGLQLIDYEGVFRLHTLPDQIKQIAQCGGVALLRHHGSLVVADTVAEAVYLAFYLEEACRIQVTALSQRVDVRVPSQSIISDTANELRSDRPQAAAELFGALRRQLIVAT